MVRFCAYGSVLGPDHWGHVVFKIPTVFIFSKDVESHLSRTFKRLKEANLKFSRKKCKLFSDKIKVLGHIITNGKLMMNEGKIEAIKKWADPTLFKHIKQFLGKDKIIHPNSLFL